MPGIAKKDGKSIDIVAEGFVDDDTIAYAVEGFPYPDVPCDWDYAGYEDEIIDETIAMLNSDEFNAKLSDIVNDCLYDAIRNVYARR